MFFASEFLQLYRVVTFLLQSILIPMNSHFAQFVQILLKKSSYMFFSLITYWNRNLHAVLSLLGEV